MTEPNWNTTFTKEHRAAEAKLRAAGVFTPDRVGGLEPSTVEEWIRFIVAGAGIEVASSFESGEPVAMSELRDQIGVLLDLAKAAIQDSSSLKEIAARVHIETQTAEGGTREDIIEVRNSRHGNDSVPSSRNPFFDRFVKLLVDHQSTRRPSALRRKHVIRVPRPSVFRYREGNAISGPDQIVVHITKSFEAKNTAGRFDVPAWGLSEPSLASGTCDQQLSRALLKYHRRSMRPQGLTKKEQRTFALMCEHLDYQGFLLARARPTVVTGVLLARDECAKVRFSGQKEVELPSHLTNAFDHVLVGEDFEALVSFDREGNIHRVRQVEPIEPLTEVEQREMQQRLLAASMSCPPVEDESDP